MANETELIQGTEGDQPAQKISYHFMALISELERVRDKIGRENPKARFFSITITEIQKAWALYQVYCK